MIIINDDYRIDSDDNCYTLQERRYVLWSEHKRRGDYVYGFLFEGGFAG